MYLKLVLIPLLLLLIRKDCHAKRENRVPPPEKDISILDVKNKHGNRHYRSVPQQPSPTEETAVIGNLDTRTADSEDSEQLFSTSDTISKLMKEMEEARESARQQHAYGRLLAEMDKEYERLVTEMLAKAGEAEGSKEETVVIGNLDTRTPYSEQLLRRAPFSPELRELEEQVKMVRTKIANEGPLAEIGSQPITREKMMAVLKEADDRLAAEIKILAKAAVAKGVKADEQYKLEEDMENDLTPQETQQVIVGDPNIILQRKRWRRSLSGPRVIRALHNMYEEKKACGNFKCKPSYVPLY